MLKAKDVPYEVKLRLRAVLHDGECDEAVAIAAAINAWPGMDTIMLPRMMQPGHFVPQDYIRLPLTEKQDDKA